MNSILETMREFQAKNGGKPVYRLHVYQAWVAKQEDEYIQKNKA